MKKEKISLIQYLIDNALEEHAKDMKLEDHCEYVQNCIKKFGIDYKTAQGARVINFLCSHGFLVYYMGDVQLLIVKRYLEKKNKRSLLDEEVFEIVENTKINFIDNLLTFISLEMANKMPSNI